MAIPYYFCLFGTNFGYLVSTNMVGKFEIEYINLLYAIVGSLQFLLCLLSFNRLPNQTNIVNDDKSNFKQELLKLKDRPRAIFSTIIISVYGGIGSAIISLIGNAYY